LIEVSNTTYWKVEDDDSLEVPFGERAELVSPVLREADIGLLMRVVDALSGAGAQVNSFCGVHVHIGTKTCDVEHLCKAIDLLIVLEPVVIERMLGINEHRRQFAGLMSREFIHRFRSKRPATFDELWLLWGGADYDQARRRNRYDETRYRGFNLHSHAFRGTVEFRYFNGPVDPQKIAEYVRLCLGIAEQAAFPLPSEEHL
jgi:hypothetical protein